MTKKPNSTISLPNDERPTDPMPTPFRTEGAGTINRLLEEVDYFTALGLYEEALTLLADILWTRPSYRLLMQQIVSRNAVASGRAGSEVRLSGGDINGANQWDDITTTDWEDRIIASRAINKAVEILRAHEDILAPSKSPSLVDARFITALSSISRNDEDAARMHKELGAAYMEMGRWSQAMGELRKVAGHPGLQAEARCLIAQCLAATARHEEAARELRQALSAFPAGSDESLAVLYDMAGAYESMKDVAQSLQCLLQIRKIRPGYRDVDQRIRAITRLDSEFLHGLLKRAEKELNTVLKHAPISIFFLDPDGRIRKASRSACLASGRAEDQVLGRLFGDVLGCCYAPCHIYASGSDSACGCCRLLRILRDTFEKRAGFQGEAIALPVRHEGGRRVMHALVSTGRLVFPEGARVVLCLEDVSDRKDLEKGLAAMAGKMDEMLVLLEAACRESPAHVRDEIVRALSGASAQNPHALEALGRIRALDREAEREDGGLDHDVSTESCVLEEEICISLPAAETVPVPALDPAGPADEKTEPEPQAAAAIPPPPGPVKIKTARPPGSLPSDLAAPTLKEFSVGSPPHAANRSRAALTGFAAAGAGLALLVLAAAIVPTATRALWGSLENLLQTEAGPPLRQEGPDAGPVKQEAEPAPPGAAALEAQETPVPKRLPFSIEASSAHHKHPAAHMIDGDRATVWQEARKKKAVGQTIVLHFGDEVTLAGLAFVTGYDGAQKDKGDMWRLNNRLLSASVEFSDGSVLDLEFNDTRAKQVRMFPAAVKTSRAVITVQGVYKGSWFNDNAIAEIEALGHPR